MTIEIKQSLKLTQQLIMTPQLQQSIKLLQLTRLELLDLIRQEIKENPVLEEKSEGPNEKSEQETQITEEFGATEDPRNDSNETAFDWENYLYEEAKTSWDPIARLGKKGLDNDSYQSVEINPDKKEGLQDYLLMQLALSQLDRDEKKCGELIIGNLDQNGYLKISLKELSSLSGMNYDLIEKTLREIQKFDPVGVAARDLKECLMLQLNLVEQKRKELAGEIIAKHLTKLSEKKYALIAKDLKTTKKEIIKAVKIIYSLEPKPGRAFNYEDPQYINPDIYVYKISGKYIVVLNEDGMPKLHINSLYRQILSGGNSIPKNSKEYIKDKLSSAAWLIKSIYHRQNTFKMVMYSIIKFQRDFFDNGIEHLKPLVLRNVAEDIDMHESTVSRVINNKYVYTPRGIFPLKFFFSSSINSFKGESFSSNSVKDTIKKIISQENPRSPCSDQEIVNILMKKNIHIARRTVTKYREMMSILSSNKRRNLF